MPGIVRREEGIALRVRTFYYQPKGRKYQSDVESMTYQPDVVPLIHL